MKVACFTDRTFYYHQKRYLEPAVVSVWEVKQSTLLAQCLIGVMDNGVTAQATLQSTDLMGLLTWPPIRLSTCS